LAQREVKACVEITFLLRCLGTRTCARSVQGQQADFGVALRGRADSRQSPWLNCPVGAEDPPSRVSKLTGFAGPFLPKKEDGEVLAGVRRRRFPQNASAKRDKEPGAAPEGTISHVRGGDAHLCTLPSSVRRPLHASRPCLKSALRTRRENEPAPPWERPRRVERSVAAVSRAL
jgi:hypothetical protein